MSYIQRKRQKQARHERRAKMRGYARRAFGLAKAGLVFYGIAYITQPFYKDIPDYVTDQETFHHHMSVTAARYSPWHNVSQFCIRSGSVDPNDPSDMEGLSVYQQALVALEHGKADSETGRALVEANADNNVLRCFMHKIEEHEDIFTSAYYDRSINLIGYNMEFHDPAAIIASDTSYEFLRGISTDYEESLHAYQFNELEAEEIIADGTKVEQFLTEQAVEAQTKVLRAYAVVTSERYQASVEAFWKWRRENPLSFNVPDDVRAGDLRSYVQGYDSSNMAYNSAADCVIQNLAGQQDATAFGDCMTDAFNLFSQYESAYLNIHTERVQLRQTGSFFGNITLQGHEDLDMDAFVEAFGAIPGTEINFLEGHYDADEVFGTGSWVQPNIIKAIEAIDPSFERPDTAPQESKASAELFGLTLPNFARGWQR